VLLDLSRMNRILDFSEELGYVTVEPGVTQAQLYSYLRDRQSNLWMDATGASPDSSLIGNTMERGFGHTPYSDHLAHACDFEVVLPTGECVQTGLSRFAGAKAGRLYRGGLGPNVEGLFTQSNLGVVIRMTIWLMPAPEHFQAFYFQCERNEDLPAVIDALRPLRLSGTLQSAMHIGNDYKVLAAIEQYPWKEAAGASPLSGAVMEGIRARLRIGCWNGSGGIYGTRVQVAEARRLIRRALCGKVKKLEFLDDRKLRLATRFAKFYRLLTGWDLSRMLEILRPVYGLLQGVPTAGALASAYWRKRYPAPAQMDLDRDGCGLFWCSPLAPLEGKHAREITRLASQTLLQYGFEPMLSLTLLTERTLACVISISYDRDVPGQDEQASACHADLLARLTEQGYYSYRLGIQSMSLMSQENGYTRLLETIRGAMDPNRILAPGRYQAAASTSNGMEIARADAAQEATTASPALRVAGRAGA